MSFIGNSPAEKIINSSDIADGAISTSDLANASVTIPKISNFNINTTSKIQPISASVAGNALTVTLNPTTLDFRSLVLSSGDVNTRYITSPISITIPSTATLGTVNATQSRIIILAIDVAGTIALAVVNIAGGNDLSETGLISTSELNTTSDANNVIYSNIVVSNVPYRVVGFIESTQATAGTWATAPSTIQGYGGQALVLSGNGKWIDQTASRAFSTTYYNTGNTTRKLQVGINQGGAADIYAQFTIDGITHPQSAVYGPSAGYRTIIYDEVPPGCSYLLATAGGDTINLWLERN